MATAGLTFFQVRCASKALTFLVIVSHDSPHVLLCICRLCKLFTNPITEVKDLAADFLFVLCKENGMYDSVSCLSFHF